MKLLSFFLLLFIFNPLMAQDSKDVEMYSSELLMGEFLNFGDRSVKFKEVISDSRCPSDVSCVWAGEAEILVELYENGKLRGEEVLVISGGGKSSVLLKNIFPKLNFQLTGYNLEPYPETSFKIKPSDYTLNLMVQEKVTN